jgi:hypothetical protein
VSFCFLDGVEQYDAQVLDWYVRRNCDVCS